MDYSVGALKRDFSEVIKKVESGETIGILYGKEKIPIAKIVPNVKEVRKPAPARKLGVLKGRMKVTFADDWEMTEEEFLGL
jgi:antitoxin (DNA-binding transcriptional repressor) of toxin-antitoxin stability system